MSSKAEILMNLHLGELGRDYKRETMLVPGRRWRWDFTIEDLAIEIQGGIFTKGGHTRGRGYTNDCQKMRGAIDAGYIPVHFTTDEVLKGIAIDWIKGYLERFDADA